MQEEEVGGNRLSHFARVAKEWNKKAVANYHIILFD